MLDEYVLVGTIEPYASVNDVIAAEEIYKEKYGDAYIGHSALVYGNSIRFYIRRNPLVAGLVAMLRLEGEQE